MKTIFAAGLFIIGAAAIGVIGPAAAAEPCNPAVSWITFAGR
jgi:hypothetical protein